MRSACPAPIPPPWPEPFVGAIAHPALWLWDSWVAHGADGLDLYTLALARRDASGAAIPPSARNKHPFHVRRFRSQDDGATWRDEGVAVAPAPVGDGYCAAGVWSGSALDLADGRRLHALTGLRDCGPKRRFLQTLFLAAAPSADAVPQLPESALLCPLRDYDAIRGAGYHLGPRDTLGADEGEDDGPILAWRDPFLTRDAAGRLRVLWSAKIGPRTPAIASAALRETSHGVVLEALLPPVALPDAALMTQSEVPKVAWIEAWGAYLLIVSACDRRSEAQPDDEVTKVLRAYRGPSLDGPWRPIGADGRLAAPMAHAFGASLLPAPQPNAVRLVAPITEKAEPHAQLTIAPVTTITLP